MLFISASTVGVRNIFNSQPLCNSYSFNHQNCNYGRRQKLALITNPIPVFIPDKRKYILRQPHLPRLVRRPGRAHLLFPILDFPFLVPRLRSADLLRLLLFSRLGLLDQTHAHPRFCQYPLVHKSSRLGADRCL